MSRYIYIPIMLSFLLCWNANSQTVSQEMALRVAENFFQLPSQLKAQNSIQVQPMGHGTNPTMYVCSSSTRWVLVAGDRRMQPILAYSDENNGIFPAEETMPDGMSYMLDWYNEQVEVLRKESNNREYHSQWEEYLRDFNQNILNRSVIISPLLIRDGHENIWKQSGNNNGSNINLSYNKFCPPVNATSYSCDHAVTGCVATAMGQVMWYWQWPYAAIVNDDANNQLLRIIDWNLMPYQLTDASSLAEANMVANLLHDAGVSVYMAYGCSGHGGSTAAPSNIPHALRNTFGYNANDLIHRNNYANNTWIGLLKNELNALRPVLYGGQSTNGGHRFVIDGYDSDNMFHINYGWGSGSSGYYSLNAISYNTSQSMVINVYPDYPSCSPYVIPSTAVWTTNFIIQHGGPLTIGNRIITSGMNGVIYSGESINLTSGFNIKKGANVYIDIKDMNCDNDRTNDTSPQILRHTSSLAPHTTSTLPIAQKVFQNGQLFILRGDNIYNTSGMLVK